MARKPPPRRPRFTIDRLAERVDVGDCWLWTAATDGHGYGCVSAGGRMVKAHRWVYEQLVGPIPAGLQIDHLCRRPLCVNPDHLEPVTQQENLRRGSRRRGWAMFKTHCARGHEYTAENAVYHPSTPHRRRCAQCERDRAAAYYARRKAAS